MYFWNFIEFLMINMQFNIINVGINSVFQLARISHLIHANASSRCLKS